MASNGTPQVDAFQCTQCQSVFLKESDAEQCCRCSECRVKFPHDSTYGSVCGHCSYGSILREARAHVRRDGA